MQTSQRRSLKRNGFRRIGQDVKSVVTGVLFQHIVFIYLFEMFDRGYCFNVMWDLIPYLSIHMT